MRTILLVLMLSSRAFGDAFLCDPQLFYAHTDTFFPQTKQEQARCLRLDRRFQRIGSRLAKQLCGRWNGINACQHASFTPKPSPFDCQLASPTLEECCKAHLPLLIPGLHCPPPPCGSSACTALLIGSRQASPGLDSQGNPPDPCVQCRTMCPEPPVLDSCP